MNPEVKQRIAMKAVIVKDGKILILREAATYEEGTNIGRYHFPGGRIEPGEKFEDGLCREVREETGLEVDIKYPLYVGEWFPTIKDVPHQIVAVFLVCESKTNVITLSQEHDHYKWIEPESYASFDLMDPDDKVIERYIEQSA